MMLLNLINKEAYRRGHNEPHSKCGCPPGYVGSNPIASANKASWDFNVPGGFFLYRETVSIRVPSLAEARDSWRSS